MKRIDLCKTLKEELEIRSTEITERTNLQELSEFDSLMMLNLIAFIDKHFHVKASVSEINKAKSVQELAVLIGEEKFRS